MHKNRMIYALKCTDNYNLKNKLHVINSDQPSGTTCHIVGSAL